MLGLRKKLRGQALLDSVTARFESMSSDLEDAAEQCRQETITIGVQMTILLDKKEKSVQATERADRIRDKLESLME